MIRFEMATSHHVVLFSFEPTLYIPCITWLHVHILLVEGNHNPWTSSYPPMSQVGTLLHWGFNAMIRFRIGMSDLGGLFSLFLLSIFLGVVERLRSIPTPSQRVLYIPNVHVTSWYLKAQDKMILIWKHVIMNNVWNRRSYFVVHHIPTLCTMTIHLSRVRHSWYVVSHALFAKGSKLDV